MKKQSEKYKKFLVGVASTTLVASAVAPVSQTVNAETSFSDIKGNTHEQAVNALVEKGIINGYEDGTFKPNKVLTRSDVVKMMGKWLESLDYKVPSNYKTTPRFKDLTTKTNDELLRYSAMVADAKVFRGYENGTLGASGHITRENMAMVLVRAYDEVYKTDLVAHVKEQTFTRDVVDLAKAKDEAKPAIDVMDYFDITNPAAPKFNPKSDTTRGQFSSLLYKTLNVEIAAENVDKEDLDDLIAKVEGLDKDDYTEESWTELEDALTTGKDVVTNEDSTDEEIKDAHNDLKDKHDKLEPVETDGKDTTTRELQQAVDEASDHQEGYFTETSWSTLVGAIIAANKVLNKSDSTQASINKAHKDLQNAATGLAYKPIPYVMGDTVTASQLTLTFTKAVDVDGAIDVVKGTVANASANVSANGKVLSITSPASAKTGETITFDLNVGGKPVSVTTKWNGKDWTMTTNPADVFKSTVKGDMGSVIELQLLNNEGNIIDGQVKLEDLLSNPNLIRLNLLPGSGLVAGDVLKLATPAFDLLNVKLTEEDISRGFIDTGINTDLLDNLTGGENLNLEAIITRGTTEVVQGVVGVLPLPNFITQPVVKAVDEITTNVVSILKGERTFKVELPVVGINKVSAGDRLKFKLRRPVVFGLGSVSKETEAAIISADDIAKGYANASFANQNLVTGLLGGLGGILDTITGGTSVYITPVLIEDGKEVIGKEVKLQISQGLLKTLLGQ